jgi:adenylate cyclase class 2
MSDHQEIEAKFIVRDPAALRGALARLGARLAHGHAELNIRLDDEAGGLTRRGMVLRVRRIEEEDAISYLLTVKTPGTGRSTYSVRREIELMVSDGTAMVAALGVLGYRPFWRYEKRRETYICDGVEIMLDEVPFGWFVEIEGPEDGIAQLAERLGLDESDELPLSYAEIDANVRDNLGLPPGDLTFDAFAGVDVPPDAYRRRSDP